MFPVLQDLERSVGEKIVVEDHAARKFADLGPQILPAHQAAADEFVVLENTKRSGGFCVDYEVGQLDVQASCNS